MVTSMGNVSYGRIRQLLSYPNSSRSSTSLDCLKINVRSCILSLFPVFLVTGLYRAVVHYWAVFHCCSFFLFANLFYFGLYFRLNMLTFELAWIRSRDSGLVAHFYTGLLTVRCSLFPHYYYTCSFKLQGMKDFTCRLPV